MQYSPQQEDALKKVNKWIKDPNGKQVFKLWGYAGTGKTSIAKEFAESVSGMTLFCAFTGKAAYVLKSKGCDNASTIHSLIYLATGKSRERLKKANTELDKRATYLMGKGYTTKDLGNDHEFKVLKSNVDAEKKLLNQPRWTLDPMSCVKDAALVVVDESSMVNEKMGMDLESFKTKILVLGDPAQLPPVYGAGYFMGGAKPDVVLTEIHRQARDNPILHLATLVIEGGMLKAGDYGESVVTRSVNAKDALSADQILVGKNSSRHVNNNRIRQLKGYESEYPQPGDRVVCLRNNHELGLLNGSQWMVTGAHRAGKEALCLGISPEQAEMGMDNEVVCHANLFLGTELKNLNPWKAKDYEAFDYGYALTVHKAQGSQWDDVLLFDQSGCFRQNAAKWLYTGLTRAAKKVRVILG